MQSVAAYYVLVASQIANETSAKAHHYEHAPRKRSRLAELVSSVTRPVRRAAAAAA